jgi:hypothetical protein
VSLILTVGLLKGFQINHTKFMCRNLRFLHMNLAAYGCKSSAFEIWYNLK